MSRAILVVTLWTVCSGAIVGAHNPGGGIQPLTAESLEAAKADGVADNARVPGSPILIRMRVTHAAVHYENFPFNFFFSTPYSTVFTIASEAKRKFTEPTFPD